MDYLPGGDYGECDTAERSNREIRIALNQTDEELLDTIIHECLHACISDLSEDPVETSAKDIAKVILKVGEWKRRESHGVKPNTTNTQETS